MGPIFINDDGDFITASVKRLGRIKIFIHTAGAGGSTSTSSSPCVGGYRGAIIINKVAKSRLHISSYHDIVKIAGVGFTSRKSYAVRFS